LAANRFVYFDGVLGGFELLSPLSLRELVGQEHDRLRDRLRVFSKHRDKIFHGQLTEEGLSRDRLLEDLAEIRLWCRSLAAGATRELGYDGFGRNSFRKASIPGLEERLRFRIGSLEEYAEFICHHMERKRRRA